jgi:hypothetical protein
VLNPHAERKSNVNILPRVPVRDCFGDREPCFVFRRLPHETNYNFSAEVLKEF